MSYLISLIPVCFFLSRGFQTMGHIPIAGCKINLVGQDQNLKNWHRVESNSASHLVPRYVVLWNYSLVLFLCLSALGCYVRAFTMGDKVWVSLQVVHSLHFSRNHLLWCQCGYVTFPSILWWLSMAFMKKPKFLTPKTLQGLISTASRLPQLAP